MPTTMLHMQEIGSIICVRSSSWLGCRAFVKFSKLWPKSRLNIQSHATNLQKWTTLLRPICTKMEQKEMWVEWRDDLLMSAKIRIRNAWKNLKTKDSSWETNEKARDCQLWEVKIENKPKGCQLWIQKVPKMYQKLYKKLPWRDQFWLELSSCKVLHSKSHMWFKIRKQFLK